jgi:transposase
VICDLERRCIIDLLPDRQPATVEDWLARHPGISVIARDRGAGYGHAAARACPGAIQVADHWHLMENASAAFLQAVRRCMRPIRKALAAGTIDVNLLTSAEPHQTSTKAFCAARQTTPTYATLQLRERRSKRPSVAQGTAVKLCGRLSEVAGPTCSGFG